MENGQLHDDKLFRAIHDRLSDYEVPYDGSEWDALSRSLDQAPAQPRFRWQMKFSLNSLLIVAGVVTLSVISYALASSPSKTGEHPAANTTQPAVTNTNETSVDNGTSPDAVQQSSPATVNSSIAASVSAQEQPATDGNGQSETLNREGLAAAPQNNSQETPPIVQTGKKKKAASDNLRFGDQIDPRKGFIYHTQESTNVLNTHHDNPGLKVVYDNVTGEVKLVEPKNDSVVARHSKAVQGSSDSTVNARKPAAPTGSEREGFGAPN